MPPTELCVIYNPKAGRGWAAVPLARLRRRWGTRAQWWPTCVAGDAEEVAGTAVRAGFASVAAAGGDGTVHEVANGLLHAAWPEVNLAVIPIGSANDYAHSLGDLTLRCNGEVGPRAGVSPAVRAVDVGVVRDPNTGRERYFVCCLGLGLNGAVTRESRLLKQRLKGLQGLALYGLAAVLALGRRYACPVIDLRLDEEAIWSAPTLMLSVLLGRRDGSFPFAPDADLEDGRLDYLHAGCLSRWQVLRLMPGVARTGPPHDHPKVRLGQGRALRVHSETALRMHIDGEFFARPEDGVRDLDIRLLPHALRVQTAL